MRAKTGSVDRGKLEMSVTDTVAKVRSGVFQIAFVNANKEKIGADQHF